LYQILRGGIFDYVLSEKKRAKNAHTNNSEENTKVEKLSSLGHGLSLARYGGGICANFAYYSGMNGQDYFKNKRVTVMGLGLLGRGLGDARFIAEAGAAEVVVTDLKTEEQLASSVAELKDFSNVVFRLGGHKEEDFKNRDLILVAAGVPMASPYLEVARKAGVPLMQSAALFALISKVPIIGITGTRGKSTVTHMIHHVLEVTTGEKVLLGGNVRGLSNLQLLNEAKEDSLCVMELDSWQLQGFGWAGISPQVAVFTNFMEDHLNYYGAGGKSRDEAMALYFKDKAQIFLHQEESGVLVTTPGVFDWIKRVLPEASLGQEMVLADSSVLPEDMLLSTPGEHNRLNAALAYEALRAVGLTDEEIFDGLASFPGVEGRLQYLGIINDTIAVYNDNNATTPQATATALQAMSGEGKVVLISGGADKNIPLEALVEQIKIKTKKVILIPGNGTDRLVSILSNEGMEVILTANLEEALEEAVLVAEAGDTILFSPAFASFSQYKNEYERNDEFMNLIKKYTS
jgi:UDP-N-acetylmuramoylalanine--D-glutamate ligase